MRKNLPRTTEELLTKLAEEEDDSGLANAVFTVHHLIKASRAIAKSSLSGYDNHNIVGIASLLLKELDSVQRRIKDGEDVASALAVLGVFIRE